MPYFKPRALGLPRREGCLGAFADKPALLFGQGGVEVEHEGIGVGAELSHDERHTLGHQAGDKGHVAREPIELGDDDWAPGGSGGCKCRGQLRPAFQRIRSLPGFDLDELADDRDPLRFGKSSTVDPCASMPRPDREGSPASRSFQPA